MKASDLDEEPLAAAPAAIPTTKDWLKLMGVGVAIVGVCVLWTFWV
jgi:hypothetical protein